MRGQPAGFPGDDDQLWYKDAIVYELHIKAFKDSDGDGIGDFRGLTEQLDYLQDLGVTAIWLLPFYPSPLKDDGYDIADYTSVNPAYGTLRDVRQFVREAHRRGLRVITELVCNHTSDQHPWFQRARLARPGSSARNFYVWSDTPEKYREARIIFKDFESSNWAWDPVAQAYYWHRFYAHQPDLNFDNPQVRRAITRVMDFWLQMGVDGLRLDAVPYLYEREGTNCENLPETHAFLKELRRHIDATYPNRMLLAEANQWPEDAVAYFGNGDECQMSFHFPLMPRMFMSIYMEDRFPIVDILAQTPPIPPSCQWALFLRNHDELTLEMVTDEERDYMYRVYAHDPQMRINLGIRRRLAPLLGNHRRRIELMNGLLLSLPGTPVIYYGDEIGMGDNIYLGDRNGVRTPMQWSPDRNAGFSTASRQRLYEPVVVDYEYHYEAVNVQAQQSNPYSLLWWMKRLIALRKRYLAFSRGTLEMLQPENRKILAFTRCYEDQVILVVANLSRYVQFVELDLRQYRDLTPVELFGRSAFPPVRDQPYPLTLGPHAFYWFALEPARSRVAVGEVRGGPTEVPVLAVAGSWTELLHERGREALEGVLPAYLQGRRWFAGKARQMRTVRLQDAVPLQGGAAYVALVQVDYTEGVPDRYVVPLACAGGEEAARVQRQVPHAVIARVRANGQASGESIVYDGLATTTVGTALLEAIAGRRRLRGAAGELVGAPAPAFRRARNGRPLPAPNVLRGEQSNTSLVYGDEWILKLFRRLEAGVNPEQEILAFLAEQGFRHAPTPAGVLEYQWDREARATAAVLEELVPNQGDAWQFTLDALRDYCHRALGNAAEVPLVDLSTRALLDQGEAEPPPLAYETIGTYLDSAHLLGRRTAELHLALSREPSPPEFAPEPFTSFYQRSLYQSARSQLTRVFQLLRRRLADLPAPLQAEARDALAFQDTLLGRFRAVIERKIVALRIRCHGDYHLGQVLYTGKDFVIIDFEGEPARPLSERRLKRSALSDVAGMLRSFHYATRVGLRDQAACGLIREVDVAALEPWVRFWHFWVGASFLRAYRQVAADAAFLPATRDDLLLLLDAHLLDKAVYEVGYELNNRPDWLSIPLQGLLQLLRV